MATAAGGISFFLLMSLQQVFGLVACGLAFQFCRIKGKVFMGDRRRNQAEDEEIQAR